MFTVSEGFREMRRSKISGTKNEDQDNSVSRDEMDPFGDDDDPFGEDVSLVNISLLPPDPRLISPLRPAARMGLRFSRRWKRRRHPINKTSSLRSRTRSNIIGL
jgi:hypothetical protein